MGEGRESIGCHSRLTIARSAPKSPLLDPSLNSARGLPSLSSKSGSDVDGQRQHRGVKEERNDCVQQDELTHIAGRNLHIGGLRGGADREREIQKIPVTRFRLMRK